MPSAVYYGQLNNGKYAIAENLKYKYGSCGNIAEVYENGTLSIKYSYDSIGRLIREDNKKLGKTYLFSYDSCGNIISKRITDYTVKPAEEISTAFEENTYAYAENSDRLLSFNGNAITNDSFGNPTSFKGNTLTWRSILLMVIGLKTSKRFNSSSNNTLYKSDFIRFCVIKKFIQ